MKGIFLILIALATLWCTSCHAQNIEDEILFMVKKVIGQLEVQEARLSSMEGQMSAVSGKIKAVDFKLEALDTRLEGQNQKIKSDLHDMTETLLTSSAITLDTRLEGQNQKIKSDLHDMTETLLNSSTIGHNEILHDLQKGSKIHDLVASQIEDECNSGNHGCSKFAQCIDTVCSYKCHCLDGYSGDGFQCDDVDECLANTDKCHPEAECTNTVGSYDCSCKRPYEGDGYNCEFKCEYSPNSLILDGHGCLHMNETIMTWEDSRLHCQSLGMRLAENIQREDFGHIWEAFGQYGVLRTSGDFYRIWVGGRYRSWVSSGEDIRKEDYWGNEPGGLLEHCIYLSMNGTRTNMEGFGDNYCSSNYPMLCQSPPFSP